MPEPTPTVSDTMKPVTTARITQSSVLCIGVLRIPVAVAASRACRREEKGCTRRSIYLEVNLDNTFQTTLFEQHEEHVVRR